MYLQLTDGQIVKVRSYEKMEGCCQEGKDGDISSQVFLKNALILILDEMTSNVDPVNESLIQDAITELAKNRTAIIPIYWLELVY